MRLNKINKFMSVTFKAGVIALAVGLQLTTASNSANAEPATYWESCTNERILAGGNTGAVLAADCRNEKGIFIPSEIGLVGIDNINGRLVQNTTDDLNSTFLETCQVNQVRVGYLFATCKNTSGRDVPNVIQLQDIDNKNGLLQYGLAFTSCCIDQTSNNVNNVPALRNPIRDEL